jgi:hypothetical protein
LKRIVDYKTRIAEIDNSHAAMRRCKQST